MKNKIFELGQILFIGSVNAYIYFYIDMHIHLHIYMYNYIYERDWERL